MLILVYSILYLGRGFHKINIDLFSFIVIIIGSFKFHNNMMLYVSVPLSAYYL